MVSGWMTAHLKVKSLHHESSSTRPGLYLTKRNRKRLKRTLGNGKVLQRSQSGLLCHTVFTGTKNLRRNSTLGSSFLKGQELWKCLTFLTDQVFATFDLVFETLLRFKQFVDTSTQVSAESMEHTDQ